MALVFGPPNGDRQKAWLESIDSRLSTDLSIVTGLTAAQAHDVIAGFLEYACQAQHITNINFGRDGLSMLPRQWLAERIEAVVAVVLDVDDEYEFVMLSDVYGRIDVALDEQLNLRGLTSPNKDVREWAQEHFDDD